MDREHTHLLLVLPDLVALQFQAVNDYILGRVAGHSGWTYSRMARSCFVTFGTDWFPPITTPPNLNDGARDMRAAFEKVVDVWWQAARPAFWCHNVSTRAARRRR